MMDIGTLAAVPGVASVVLGDRAGTLLDAVQEPEAESVAAVAGFLTTALEEAGEQLGLGPLQRLTFAGASRACLLAVDGTSLLTARVQPPGSLAAVERALDTAPHGQG